MSLKFSVSNILQSLNTRYFGFQVKRLSSCSGFCLKESQLPHETCLFNSSINPKYLSLIIVPIRPLSEMQNTVLSFLPFLFSLWTPRS